VANVNNPTTTVARIFGHLGFGAIVGNLKTERWDKFPYTRKVYVSAVTLSSSAQTITTQANASAVVNVNQSFGHHLLGTACRGHECGVSISVRHLTIAGN